MTPRQHLEVVLDPRHAEDVIAHRKAIRKPLSEGAARLLAREFAKCPDPNAASEEMIIRGWQGFKADWLAQRPQQQRRQPQSIHDVFAGLHDRMKDANNGQPQRQIGTVNGGDAPTLFDLEISGKPH